MSSTQRDREAVSDGLDDVDLDDPVNLDHPLNRGRCAWWLCLPGFEGGDTWPDLMGLSPLALNSYNAGYGWQPSTRPGGAGQVVGNGVNSYAKTASSSSIVQPATITVAAWFYFTSGPGGGATIVWSGNNGPSPYGAWGIEYPGPYFHFQVGTTAFANYAASFGTPTASTWYRLVGVYDGSNVLAYTNGLLAGTSAASGTLAYDSTGIGIAAKPTAQQFYNAAIDDVSVWSRPLSAAEVLADYDLSGRGYPGVLNRI